MLDIISTILVLTLNVHGLNIFIGRSGLKKIKLKVPVLVQQLKNLKNPTQCL